MLLGYISGGSGRSILLGPPYATAQDHSFYFQDDWRVSWKLTLRMGVRYDVFVPDKEIRKRLVNFDQTKLTPAYAGENGVSREVGKQARKGNIGRGVLYSPGLIKRRQFGVTFQVAAFNLTNTPYFGFPIASIGCATAGQITSTNSDNRDLQVGLRFNL